MRPTERCYGECTRQGEGMGRLELCRCHLNNVVPSTGLEPVAYRLGGGRSIHLSYEGGAGAIRGRNPLPVRVGPRWAG